MESELASILTPAGLRLQWFAGQAAPDSGTWRNFFFRIHGSCAASPVTPVENSEPVTLAETASSGSTILPYSQSDCDRLRDFLAPADSRLAGQEGRLGRAMGRLLAHELYHFLLQTRLHGKTGIAKAVHTPAALLSRSLRFEDDEIRRIRSVYSASVRNRVAAPVAAFAARTAAE